MSELQLPDDIIIECKQIMQCGGCAARSVNTVKLSSRSMDVFNSGFYFTAAGIELSDTKYLLDLNFDDDKFQSVIEVGTMVKSIEDVESIKKFMDKYDPKINMYHLWGDKKLIKDNFKLGSLGIMGVRGRIFYHKDSIEDCVFTIQGIVKNDDVQELISKSAMIRTENSLTVNLLKENIKP